MLTNMPGNKDQTAGVRKVVSISVDWIFIFHIQTLEAGE